MAQSVSNRRSFITSILSLIPLGIFSKQAAAGLMRTPSATAGPYYPTESMRFADIDNDLVKIVGAVEQAGGEVITLGGRVLNAAGNPIKSARVEIWQCDANGRYMHTSDPSGAPQDMGFQGFGYDLTDADGSYNFRTIMPVSYPGRTPHIHVKVIAPERELISQFYIAGHAMNERDGLYSRMSNAERTAVEMRFSEENGTPHANVDIVI